MEEMGSDTSSQSALYPLLSALVAIAIAQSIKFFTAWYKERRWDFKQLVGSGGMPSSHAASVTALAMSIGFQEDFGGSLFVAAMIVAGVVMYDATGLWLHVGRQAEILNQIVDELPDELPAEHPLAEGSPLRELLGRTPEQVIVGSMLGVVTATIGHSIILAASQS